MLKRLKSCITTFDASTGWHHYIGPYTIMFLVMMVLMVFSFLLAGKGFIWAVDGLSQQYVFFAYEGIWLRELIGNLFTGQDLPLWTSQIGWGGDPFIALLSCIGDPINLLSVFVPTRFADYALNLTVPLRLYLAGLAFAGLCFYKGKTHFATLTASMVYIFSAFTSIAFTQIFMLYPLILAPLALWGAEKLFNRESPVLFIVSMALMFMAGLTLGYSACLLLLAYCIVRFIFLPNRANAGVLAAEKGSSDNAAPSRNNVGEKSARLFFILLGKFVGCIAIGAAISAIILIPSAMAILSQGRIGLERPDDLLYAITYYQSLLQGFVGHADVGADCAYGFAAIALVCVFMLFCQKARDLNNPSEVRILRTMFVLLFIFLCLPFIGRIFNGFAYANNRWVWGFVLLIAYIVASMLPECLTLSKRQGRSIFKYAVVFSLALVLLCFPVLSRNASFGLLMMFAVLVLLTGSLGLSKATKEGGVLLSVAICVAFLFNTYGSQFVGGGSTWALNMTGLGRAYKTVIDNDPTTQLQQMEHDEFWRYDAAGVDLVHNGNLLQDMNALRFYSSFYNQYIDDFQTGLGLRTSSINFMYSGLDSRAELESLAGVKYMVSQKGSESLVPETFVTYQNDVNVNGRIFDYSESDYNLPLIYLHDGAIPASSYEEMTPIQKQEALLQGVVLEDDGAAEMLKSGRVLSRQSSCTTGSLSGS